MTKKDIETTLIAALLHDIGQYPLAHDLEDVRELVFNHEGFSAEVLDGTINPGQQPSIRESIHAGGWSIDWDLLKT